MKIGIIGSGIVGQTLATGLDNEGHDVSLGTGTTSKISELTEALGGSIQVGTFEEVADTSEIVFLCVKGSVAEKVIHTLTQQIENKPVIDTTNPISDSEPVDGVPEYFTDQNESLMERLQSLAPKAQFVKAFNSVGSGMMIHPKLDTTPTMFICGNEAAKKRLRPVIESLGWEIKDLGAAAAARPIEDLCKLWCIPGFKDNHWQHAFKFLSADES